MATIYDFPTNYESKLLEATQLMEKGYTDQAICLLEDFLEIVTDIKVEHEVKKQLITCYMLKREFETCEQLILEIKQKNGLDLMVAAHDILVTMFQNPKIQIETKQQEYIKQLGLNLLTRKNLIELIYHLKGYYEEYWCRGIEKKLQVLIEEQGFEMQLMVLSDLQDINPEFLRLYQDRFELIINQCKSPIIKTMLFELLVKKGITCSVTYKTEETYLQLQTTEDNLREFYQHLNQAIKTLYQSDLSEERMQLLHQHLIFFYQFLFPFVKEIDEREVINQLAKSLLGVESLLPDYSKRGLKAQTNIDIIYKMSQYILSLSSLM